MGTIMSYEKLYHEELLEHYTRPRNRGTVAQPDFSSGVLNPSCGDEISMQGLIKDETITQCVFDGKGCVISLAAASLLTEWVTGLSLEAVLDLTPADMIALVKLQLGPNRLRCALLALEALHKGLREYLLQKG